MRDPGDHILPFNKPFIIGKELEYIAQAVANGHLAGDGSFTKQCQAWMEKRFGTPRVMLTHSCTAALEMAAILAEVQPGDEIILPSFTFVSTANAFVLRGAVPVWCDIRSDTLNMDETRIEPLITPRTRAIVPVHYAGVGCDMDAIMETASENHLLVIEDAAQAVNATYGDRYLGTIGHLGCYSFHETKNMISGEGGALAINDPRLVERAEIIREKGTNRSRYFRGLVDRYTWVDCGSSYLPSELVAAFLYAQLEEADKINRKRLASWRTYYELLQPREDAYRIRLPHVPADCGHNAHMFYILLETQEIRDGLMDALRKRGILSVFHYVPLHSSPMGLRVQPSPASLPVTDDMSRRLLRLPMYYELSPESQKSIVDAIDDFFHTLNQAGPHASAQ
jgi:dTDP-4-amino-4,6-dideoxygalactose transaminase